MKLLILGGTVFVGRHLVDHALAAGCEVTTFNRRREDVPVPDGVEALTGDRRGDLAALRGRRWDAAIDVAAYVPSVVRSAAALLRDAVEHYTLVSSRSVYADPARSREGDPLAEITDAEVAEAEALVPEGRSSALLYGPRYGGLKVRCEAEARAALPDRTLVVRPGLVVGPYDPSDRFTWWPVRLARGGDVLAPGRPERPVRILDARDLAAWMVDLAIRRTTGTFDAGGADGLTMAVLLDACRRASASDARLVWVDEAFLTAQGVAPWSDLPLWLPEALNAFLEAPNDRAVQAGLRFRSVEETAADTLAWARTRGEVDWRAGLPPEREEALLAAWRAA
ncbi:MAG: epimerase [Myxococcota bacterium]